jgi:hypothetical protein
MTTTAPNPFDTFPEDGTPHQFWDHALRALNWLEPYLVDTDEQHRFFIMTCQAYGKMLYPDQENDDAPEDWPLLIMRQRQIVTVFGQIRHAIIAAKAVTKAEAYSTSQSERASKPRARDEEEAMRIAKAYWTGHNGRAERGRVKELAREYGVTEATIRNYARKYKPN